MQQIQNLVGRFAIPSKKQPLWHAVDDPRYCGESIDEDDWWDRSFANSAPQPDSEPEGGPSFLLIQSAEGPIPEARLMRLQFDDVRISYGLADVEDRDPGVRDAEIAATLRSILQREFRGVPPEYFNKTGARNGALDAITSHGKPGYAFALSGLVPEFVVHYPGCFRCREHEMLRALRELVLSVGLAPVIHWSRDAGTWIFNLWD